MAPSGSPGSTLQPSVIGTLVKRTPLRRLLMPGYPDGARLLIQEPIFRELLRERPFAGRCLNAGCGEGLFCPFLESFSAITRIDNIDISLSRAMLARRADPRHHAAQGSLTALPCENAAFDCCLCTEVLEHVPDHEKALAELARVLKPGGLLLLSVPQTPAPWDPNHARQGYTFEELRALLETAGFRTLARRDCFHGLMRAIMAYWRRPWLRFGKDHTPYLPKAAVHWLAKADSLTRLGKPWDLIVLARR